MADREVHSTKNYKKFKTLLDNRQVARTHINRLKDAIQRNPEILKVQPILVNEKMEIIDGQHRFHAASELDLPIYYTQVKGLDISTAREMNVMQRRWLTDDYAYSFAKAGNVNYKAYNLYRRENPGLASTVIILVLSGGEQKNMSFDFRTGEFVIKRDQADIEWTLEQLNKIRELTGHEVPLNKSFVSAYLKAVENEDFDNDAFLANLKKKPDMFQRTSVLKDSLRMIEDICNFHKSTNLIRLY